MAWKIFSGPSAILSRRRVFASALLYGLTLTIRLTNPAGEEAEKPPLPATQKSSALLSIMAHAGNPALTDRTFRSARPLVSRACRSGCDRPLQLASVPDCLPP